MEAIIILMAIPITIFIGMSFGAKASVLFIIIFIFATKTQYSRGDELIETVHGTYPKSPTDTDEQILNELKDINTRETLRDLFK